MFGVFGAQEVRVAGPACAVYVVCRAFDGIGEDRVGGDDEPVTFEAVGSGDVSAQRSVCGMFGVVWVVELHELAEARFAVGGTAGVGEDLVGCR